MCQNDQILKICQNDQTLKICPNDKIFNYNYFQKISQIAFKGHFSLKSDSRRSFRFS